MGIRGGSVLVPWRPAFWIDAEVVVPRNICVYIGSPAASPYLRPRRASRVWGWVGEVVRICYTYRLVGVCVCVCGWVWAVSNVGLTHVGQPRPD